MTRRADQMIPTHIYAPAKSVRLSSFGRELIRLHRATRPTEYEDGLAIHLSARSNGWILKKVTSEHGTRGVWVKWQYWPPFSSVFVTSTLPQQIRYLIDHCGYTIMNGSMKRVAAGYAELCRKAAAPRQCKRRIYKV